MTILFFLGAASLVLTAIAFVVPVILRDSTKRVRIDRRQKNIDIARQRLEDLDRGGLDGDSGDVDAEDIRREIERGLLDDVERPDDGVHGGDDARNAKVRQWTAVVSAVLIPVSAGLIYLVVGEPAVIGNPGIASAPATVAAVDTEQSGIRIDGESISFETMTQRVMAHLADNPTDIEGWTTLASLFIAQRQFSEAASAYRKVRELSGDSADMLVREADALAMANDGDLSGEPESLVLRALQLDSDHASALWLAGIAAAAREDYSAALGHWRRAEAVIPNDEFVLEIRQLIASVEAELSDRGQPAPAVAAAAGRHAVQATVSADSTVLAQVDDEDALFVFARASDGPPVPLAVVRRQVKDLPLVVDLDDSLAMMENLRLSAFEEVMIVARISKSGAPAASSGDFFGEVGPIRPAERPEVAITISERVP